MATSAETLRPAGLARGGTSVRRPAWPAPAWASIAVSVVFVALSCWWLSRDRSIPVFDAGIHLGFAIDAYEALGAGHVLRALTESTPYPPLAYLVGALGVWLGGVGVAPAIIAENVVFVPLLALGCYKVGRLAFGPLAGLLAVVFALGSPLIVEEFHEFMLDAPETAMVAIAVWALLASRRFSAVGCSALAGLAVGLGMLTKETFVFFIAGVVAVTALRGGRRAWRGMLAFAAVALAVAAPWYLRELSTIHTLGGEAFGSSSAMSGPAFPAGIAPPRLSAANLEWYMWSFLNWQLLAPLFAFAALGALWTLVGFARRRPVSRFAPELAVGALVSWVAITETFVHAARYGMPMTLYLAVLAAGWIASLPRPWRAVLALALGLVAAANTLGVGFGVGKSVASEPLGASYEQQPDRVVLYADYGLWVGPPARDGDLLGLLRAMRHGGVRTLEWDPEQEPEIEFSPPGITVLARIAGLRVVEGQTGDAASSSTRAVLIHGPGQAGLPPPCFRLRDGDGVWARLADRAGPRAWSLCPGRSG
jgi:hypothetical protein